MAYEAAVRLGTSSHIKTGQGNPVGRKKSQKQGEDLETVPASTFRGPEEEQDTEP